MKPALRLRRYPLQLITLLVLLSMFTFRCNCDSLPQLPEGEFDLPSMHVIEDVPFYQGPCGIASMRMALGAQDAHYTFTYLMNLGWNYGFLNGFMHSESAMSAVEYAAKKLQSETEYYKRRDFDESLNILRFYLAHDIPVFIQGETHTILAVGYDNERQLVYIHDPAGGASPGHYTVERPELGAYLEVPYTSASVEDPWGGKSLNNFWQATAYEMIVVGPPVHEPEIDWGSVLEHNARLTRRGVYELIRFAKYSPRLETFPAQSPSATYWRICGEPVADRLVWLYWMFRVGYSCRRDASAFLQGLAVMSELTKLQEASLRFRWAAECYTQGEIFTWQEILFPGTLPDVFQRLSDLILQAAGFESEAAELLSQGAAELSQWEASYLTKPEGGGQ